MNKIGNKTSQRVTWVWRNGGISPQKRQCDFGSFVPARALVEAATAPSPCSLAASRYICI